MISYFNPTLLPLVEYAGRTCYRTNENKKTPRDKFVSNIVRSGHESVIEHSNGIIVVPFNIAANNMGALIDIQTKTPVRCITHCERGYAIYGNIRVFKDIFRAGQNDESLNILMCAVKEFLETLPCPIVSDLEFVSGTEKFKDKELSVVKSKGLVGNPVLLHIDDVDAVYDVVGKNTRKQDMARMVTASFQVDMPRSCSHQEVRHRISNYSQESQRYVNMKNIFDFHTPDSIDPEFGYDVYFGDAPDAPHVVLSYNDFMSMAHGMYKALNNAGVKPEDAREVLPNATISRIVITRTIEQWSHYFSLRCEKHAQKPIRERANAMKEMLMTHGSDKLLELL